MSTTQTDKAQADAVFIGYQETASGRLIALYNVMRPGHPRLHSTVTAQTLRALGLRVPPTQERKVT